MRWRDGWATEGLRPAHRGPPGTCQRLPALPGSRFKACSNPGAGSIIVPKGKGGSLAQDPGPSPGLSCLEPPLYTPTASQGSLGPGDCAVAQAGRPSTRVPRGAHGDVHEVRVPHGLWPPPGPERARTAVGPLPANTPGLRAAQETGKGGSWQSCSPPLKLSWGRRVSMHLHVSWIPIHGATQRGISQAPPRVLGRSPPEACTRAPAMWLGSARPGWGACIPCRGPHALPYSVTL